MKKTQLLLWMGILVVSLFSWTFASADCQEIRFSNGEKFCFDIQKISSERFRASISKTSLSTLSDLSCNLTLPNKTQVSLSRCEGEFSYGGNNGSIEIRADIQNYWYELITNYDFRNGSFSSYWDHSSYNYSPEITSVSNESPRENEWVDITLRVRNNFNSSYYNDSVNFYVEAYKNGRRDSASSYDYQLDRSSYRFSYSDQGEVRLRNFIKFTNEGEFRVIAKLHNYNNEQTGQEFYVQRHSSDRWRSVDTLSIHSINPSSPRIDQWIDITVRAVDRYGDIVRNYDRKVRFEVEEYRNGSWRNASSSEYTIDNRTAYFSRYDNGEKTFSDLIKFRTRGEFRIKVIDDWQSWIYGSKEITVRANNDSDTYYPNYYQGNFTDKELKKIRAVSEIWNNVIAALEKDYPRLRRDSQWKKVSDDFYRDMQGILRNSNSSFRNWSEFYSAFQSWLSLTIRTR